MQRRVGSIDKPLPTSHFWMTSAICDVVLVLHHHVAELPLMPMSGRLIQSTVPPAALMASP